MTRKSRIKLVGKRAQFAADKWARALETLAQQLRQEAAASPEATDRAPSDPEDGRSC